MEGAFMNILTPFQERTDQPLWHLDPELALVDTVLTCHPEMLDLVKDDILALGKNNGLGRQDSPSVEQVVRAAIYKEIKGLSYEDLEYHQHGAHISGEGVDKNWGGWHPSFKEGIQWIQHRSPNFWWNMLPSSPRSGLA